MKKYDGWNRDASGEPDWFKDYPAIRSKAGLFWFVFCLAVILFFAGCVPDINKKITVTVVSIRCETRIGGADCTTFVQGPDSLRYRRSGKWGEMGDTFNIYANKHNQWMLSS